MENRKQNTITEKGLQELETFIGLHDELGFLVNNNKEFAESLVVLIFNALSKRYDEIKQWNRDGVLEIRRFDDDDNSWYPAKIEDESSFYNCSIYKFRKRRENKIPKIHKTAAQYREELIEVKKVLNERLIEIDKTILELSARIDQLLKENRSIVKPRVVDLDISL